MRDETVAQLLRLNREFYQTFAQPFAETRQRLQPGVVRVLKGLSQEASILDLGCGNGQLAHQLARQGHRGPYLGLDASAELLAAARRDCPLPQAQFLQADLADPAWTRGIPSPFDHLLAFAVLHHLPGHRLRTRVATEFRRLIAQDGRLTLSVWDFMASQRLRKRIVSWDTLDLDSSDVDAGDYLIDWRRGGQGLRYVHHFTPEELTTLATQAGFSVKEHFHADGEGGRLGLYQVWEPIS
ncbi:MAG: class I SAM-dependent methyltransferase [Anaerolineales bacterium]